MSSVVPKETRCNSCGMKMIESRAMFKDADGNKRPVEDIRDGKCFDCLGKVNEENITPSFIHKSGVQLSLLDIKSIGDFVG